MSEPTKNLQEFLAESPDNRSFWLDARKPEAVSGVLREWASFPSLQLDEVCALEGGHRILMEKYVRESGRTFVVQKNPQYKAPVGVEPHLKIQLEGPVLLDSGFAPSRGRKRGGRLFTHITKPVQLPADKALQAMHCFGEYAQIGWSRGRLVQMSEQQYLAWSSGGAQQAALEEAALKERSAQAELAEARAEAEAAKAQLAALQAQLNQQQQAESQRKKK